MSERASERVSEFSKLSSHEISHFTDVVQLLHFMEPKEACCSQYRV